MEKSIATVVSRNIFVATVTWVALCAMARRLLFTKEEAASKLREEHLYLQVTGSSPRYEAESIPHQVDVESGGDCLGFPEAGSRCFVWGGENSRRSLVARSQSDGSWTLEFQAYETKRQRRRQVYLHAFLEAVSLSTLEIIQLSDPEVLIRALTPRLGISEERFKEISELAEKLVPGTSFEMPVPSEEDAEEGADSDEESVMSAGERW